MFSTVDWRCPRPPPWMSFRSGTKTFSLDPFEVMYMYSRSMFDRKRRPQRPLRANVQGKGVHRVPSLEELDKYGGRFKKDEEYQQSKEMDPMDYAWLIQKEFVLSIKSKRRLTTNKKNGLTMENLNITDNIVPNSMNKSRVDVNSLQHLDLATGWASSRQVLVEEVISYVFARAEESPEDLSRLQRLGMPARYLPIIAEAIQAEHLSQFKHLDLANSGSFGEKSVELRRLVEKRLPAFLRWKILP